ncbi:MAG: hypothetical protein K8R86_01875 [Bacteroidales bacterium]|nr:hypothetical protein [Bacteroidales bacterium]
MWYNSADNFKSYAYIEIKERIERSENLPDRLLEMPNGRQGQAGMRHFIS